MANQITVDILVNVEGADKSLDKIQSDAKKTASVIVKAFDKADMAIASFVGNIGADIFKSVLSSAKDLFNFIGKDAVAAAQAQEEAINKMNIALQSTGLFTESTSRDMQKFSESLQGTTKFADELILENMALIQSLGDLSEQGLKDATQAAADLASALGIDLRTAATLVGKAAAGEVGSFSRYGLAIKKGADDAETFANALDAINSKFGGAASGQIKTFTGATAQLTNTIGDLQEKFGEIIIKNPAVISAIGILNKGFLELQKVVEDNKSNFEPLVTLLAETFGQSAEAFFKGTSIIIKGLAQMAEWVANNSTAVDFLRTVFGNMVPGLDKFIMIMDKINGDASAGEIKKVSDQMLYLQENADKAKGSFENLFAGLPEASKVVSPLLSPEQLQEEMDKEAALIDKGNQDKLDKQTAFEESLKAIKDQYKLAEEEEKVAKAELDKAIAEGASLAEQEFLIAHLDALALLKLDAQIKELTARGDHYGALKKMEEKFAKEKEIAEKKSAKTSEELRKEQAAKDIQTIQQWSGAVTGLLKQGSKEQFAVTQAAALATAIVKGFESIAAAAAIGPPQNVPAVLAAKILMGLNIAGIAKQTISGFEFGGIVPGNSFNGDKIPAMVNSGEMILNQRQQKNLFESINGGSGGTNITIQGNVMADDDSQVIKLIDRINDAVQFGNAQLRPA